MPQRKRGLVRGPEAVEAVASAEPDPKAIPYAVSSRRAVAKVLGVDPDDTVVDRPDLPPPASVPLVPDTSMVDRVEINRDRIAQALARLAFADIRALFSWGPDGVVLKSSHELTDAQAFSVIEVSQTDKGIKLKVADKRAALMDLAKLQGFLDGDKQPGEQIDAVQRRAVREKLLAALDDLARPEPLVIEADDAVVEVETAAPVPQFEG